MTTSIPFTLLLSLLSLALCSCTDTNKTTGGVGCIDRERKALLKLKQSLTDPSGRLSSWHGQDCCTWEGVTCGHKHGFIIKLRLRKNVSADDELPLGGEINPSLLQLKHLRSLDLGYNNFKGILLPTFIGSLHNLERLVLPNASFGGLLPPQLGNLSKLDTLYLQYNKFNGSIPKTLGKLSSLCILDLSYNPWEGAITEAHFENLTSLTDLTLTSSSTTLSPLKFDVSPDWIPPFNLIFLDLKYNQVGPKFPSWIQTQTGIQTLYLRKNGISDSIPRWFGNFTDLFSLDLSYNHIRGRLPFPFPSLETLILSHNLFSESIPSNIHKTLPVLQYLDISENLLTGEIPSVLPNLIYLNLSRNFINGSIPSSVCNMTRMQLLILSNNRLSGEIPRCSWESLKYLDLGTNHLTGKIPVEMGFSRLLSFIKLNNNSLYGEVPPFQELKLLITLDLGENNLSGAIRMWMAKGLSSLEVLRLRFNSFEGHIPTQLCNLSSLQVIDLGHNRLSGSIPQCFGSLTALAEVGGEKKIINDANDPFALYLESMGVAVVKGRELDYSSNLIFLRSIDLSNNNLSGEIPNKLTGLIGLNILNLSMNHLTGRIPQQIGNMKQLESLDLSQNHLLGMIPPSMSDLNYLSHLNLSYNNLSGRVPSGNQLQTLNDSSIYEGNPRLCGSPLRKKCPGDERSPDLPVVGDEDGDDTMWFYLSMATGFIVGFGGACCSLLLSKSWRRSYFQFIGDMNDTIYVAIVVRIRRLRPFSKTP